ncbi:MAG TPA: hypothetical protein VNI20_08125 [Fimbriimonadaceae bacterium]|nr:hypothetical protein [Fimbriimonadaceae bacterium]
MAGAHSLDQKFRNDQFDDRLSEDEVQAIIKRYGERQAGGDTRPTVTDVAEALQVEPTVVERLLRDIRSSESEKQLKERLDALELENAQLRRRAEESDYGYDDFYSSTHWRRRGLYGPRRRIRLAAVMAAVGVAVMLASSSRGGNAGATWAAVPLVGMLASFIILMKFMRRRD